MTTTPAKRTKLYHGHSSVGKEGDNGLSWKADTMLPHKLTPNSHSHATDVLHIAANRSDPSATTNHAMEPAFPDAQIASVATPPYHGEGAPVFNTYHVQGDVHIYDSANQNASEGLLLCTRDGRPLVCPNFDTERGQNLQLPSANQQIIAPAPEMHTLSSSTRSHDHMYKWAFRVLGSGVFLYALNQYCKVAIRDTVQEAAIEIATDAVRDPVQGIGQIPCLGFVGRVPRKWVASGVEFAMIKTGVAHRMGEKVFDKVKDRWVPWGNNV
jgi:hypothetical protein